MLCPWQTITTEHYDIFNKKITEIKFSECIGSDCPFLRLVHIGFDSVGFSQTKEYCTRTEFDKGERKK